MMADINGTPQKIRRCNLCFVNIFDNLEHTCVVSNERVSWFRTNTYAATPWSLFELEYNCDMYYLNTNIGRFEKIFDGQTLLSASTDGLICFKKKDDSYIASYAACSFKRFSIIVATCSGNHCRLLFRVEICADQGLKFYKIDSELPLENDRVVLPIECKLNTAIVLGVEPKSLWMDFRVFANTNGDINYENFNGYTISRLIGNPLELKVINN